jgi:TolB protein
MPRSISDASSNPSRRLVLAGAAGLTAGLGLGGSALAQIKGRTEGEVKPIVIAVPDFISADPKLGADLARIVAADLDRSGLFQVLDPQSFIQRVQNFNVLPTFSDWSAIGAEALVVGQATPLADGRLQLDIRVYDVGLKKPLAGNRLVTPLENWRRVAHQAADLTYEKMTLEKGYFDTRIVFIDETGPKAKRLKRLAIMDQDGANLGLLSQGRELVLTPRFSPNGREITFMQFVNQQWRAVLMNIESRAQEVLGDFPGGTIAPRFAPDGQRVVLSVGEGAATNIMEMDLRSKRTRVLTDTEKISTGPCYSPDAAQIVFESDREGTQQLYLMPSTGGGARRLSTGEGRYSTPVWAPNRGEWIAFTKQLGGRFLIGVMKPDGSGERILTEGFHNEGPTWAPNGRVLMFFREQPGNNGGPKLFTVDVTGYNERPVPTPAFGSDPAWSPLMA